VHACVVGRVAAVALVPVEDDVGVVRWAELHTLEQQPQHSTAQHSDTQIMSAHNCSDEQGSLARCLRTKPAADLCSTVLDAV
jgi:hypothetical protein